MGSFVVLLHEDADDNEAIREKIEEAYPPPQSYEFSDEVIFISGPTLTNEITKELGFDEDEGRAGAIVSLNGSFGGRSYNALWEWLRTVGQPR